MFEEDLKYLRRQCTLVGLEGLEERPADAPALPRPVALITVDDGLAESHSTIRPILLRNGVPAVFFIPTDFIDNKRMFYRHKASLLVDRILMADPAVQVRILSDAGARIGVSFTQPESLCEFILSRRSSQSEQIDRLCDPVGLDVDEYLRTRQPYLSKEQIQELVRDGFSIGAHSLDHREFVGLTPTEIERQIVDSCRVIATVTGKTQVSFAFPFNMFGLDRRMLLDIAKANPVVGTLFEAGGMIQTRPFVNRVFADSPDRGVFGGSNLPRRLRELYKEYWNSGEYGT